MKEIEQKHMEAIRDCVTADTSEWGEYGGQNKESLVEAAKECALITQRHGEIQRLEGMIEGIKQGALMSISEIRDKVQELREQLKKLKG